MDSVKQINLNGTVYDIMDETARTTAEAANTAAGKAQTTATDAKNKAELALDGAYDISYASNVLTFTKKSAE